MEALALAFSMRRRPCFAIMGLETAFLTPALKQRLLQSGLMVEGDDGHLRLRSGRNPDDAWAVIGEG